MRLRRLAIAAIVAICVGAPIVEMFDRWDDTLKDGNDTEANAVLVAVCVGIAFVVGTVVVATRLRALSATSPVGVVTVPPVLLAVTSFIVPIPTSSPPVPLRV